MRGAALRSLLLVVALACPSPDGRCPIGCPTTWSGITNDSDPEFAAPEAKRGGTFRTSMPSFPLTLRRVGPDSNGGFAGYLRYNQLGAGRVASKHPPTDSVAGVALGIRR